MDLTEYERAKFELAGILRSAAVLLQEEKPDVHGPFADLFARLAEDRFNLVVVGRFSRGKSSLMNAMLETERLPTGIVPLTSVITTVSYGSRERAMIQHEGWSLRSEISLDQLPDYVTQQGNPGNQRRVRTANIELPSELLRRGFYFVDTPGLGSSILANTRTTESFLPQADAFMLVTSYDSPLSEEELRVLHGIAASPGRIFLVVNKHDTASLEERHQVLAHVRDQARAVFGDQIPTIFSVSAREAMDANKQGDKARLAASGVSDLRDELTRFLLTEKQGAFLAGMCERVADALRSVPNARSEAARLTALHRAIGENRPEAMRHLSIADMVGTDADAVFESCWVCEQLDRGLYDFLCKYQWKIAFDPTIQANMVDHGGLCAFHCWQYASVASPLGTCVALSPLLERLAERLQRVATSASRHEYGSELHGLRPTPDTCDICRVHLDIERGAVTRMATSIVSARTRQNFRFPGLCLTHLGLVVQSIDADEPARELLVEQAAMLKRLSEDMRRYALKHEGVRRYLASDEETSADHRALMLLGGHRNVSGLRRMG